MAKYQPDPQDINQEEYGTCWRAAGTEFRKCFCTEGRESLAEGRKASQGLMIGSFLIAVLAGLILALTTADEPIAFFGIPFMSAVFGTWLIYFLANAITAPAAFVRKRHDKGKSGAIAWLLLPAYLTVVLAPIIYLIVCVCCFPTTERDSDNIYGPADRNAP